MSIASPPERGAKSRFGVVNQLVKKIFANALKKLPRTTESDANRANRSN
jgi:hypothetical protein